MVRDTRGDDDVEPTEYFLPRIHRTDVISACVRYPETREGPSREDLSDSSPGDSKLDDDGSRLITVSFDGEIIIWEIYTCTPVLFLNTDGAISPLTFKERNLRVSPYIFGVPHVPHLQPETASISDFLHPVRATPAQEKSKRLQKPKGRVRDETSAENTGEKVPSLASATSNAVSCLLLLDARPDQNSNTATILTASVDGFIRGWSESGLCAVFHGGKTASNYIRCMATDSHNELLLTGDNAGYLTVYFIGRWANAEADQQHQFDPRPFPAIRRYRVFAPVLAYLNNRLMWQALVKLDSRHAKFYSMPVLLNVYRAHLSAIQHISVIVQRQIVITSSLDCSVRLWTFAGLYIGTLGQTEPLHLDISADAPPVPHYDFQQEDAHAALEEIFAEKDTMEEILLQPRTVVPPDLASRASKLTLEVVNDLKHTDLLQWLRTNTPSGKVTPTEICSPRDEVAQEVSIGDNYALYENFPVKSLENLGNLHDLLPDCVYNYNVEKVQDEFIGRLPHWQRPGFIKSQREGTLHGERMRQLVQLVHVRPIDHRHKRSQLDAGHVRTTLQKMGSSGRRTLVDFLLEPDAASFVGTLLSADMASREMESEVHQRQRTVTALPVVAGNMAMLTDIQALEKQARRRKRPVAPVELVLVPDAEEARAFKGELYHGASSASGVLRVSKVELNCTAADEKSWTAGPNETPIPKPQTPENIHPDAESDDFEARSQMKRRPTGQARAVHRAPLSVRGFLKRRKQPRPEEEQSQDAHYEKLLHILSQPLDGSH